MRPIIMVMTIVVSLAFGSITLHAQSWQMPTDNQRCPSKWGPGDQRGSGNWMKPETVLRAAKLIRTGEVFELGDVLSPDPKETFVNRNRIYNIVTKYSVPKPNTRTEFEEFPMIGSNGLALDRQGRLIIATWAGRSIDRIEKNGKRTVLADRYEGKRFGGTNDVVVKKDGSIYFTDGFGGLRLREKDPRRELDFNGVYMLRDGKVTLVIKDIPNTNGLAFSPDEKYLYANGSRDKFVKRYEVQPNGTLTNGKMFIDISKDPTPGITDGLRVDSKGNLYETAPGGVWIISAEGKHLGTILTPELAANVEFGDADRKTLYIAARTSIYKIRLNTPGIP